MLKIDDQRARSREAKSGADREVPFGHGGGTLRGQRTGRRLRLGRAVVMSAGVLGAGPAGARTPTSLYWQDDRTEPGAAYTTGRTIFGHQSGTDRDWPQASLSFPLHTGRYRVTAQGR